MSTSCPLSIIPVIWFSTNGCDNAGNSFRKKAILMSIFANLAGGLNFLQSLFLVALFYDQPSWRRKNGAVKSNSQTSDRYTSNPWMSAIMPAHRLYTDTSSCKNRGCLCALVGHDHLATTRTSRQADSGYPRPSPGWGQSPPCWKGAVENWPLHQQHLLFRTLLSA